MEAEAARVSLCGAGRLGSKNLCGGGARGDTGGSESCSAVGKMAGMTGGCGGGEGDLERAAASKERMELRICERGGAEEVIYVT